MTRNARIAATGMAAQQTNVNVISNNIANANTTGFKASRAAFRDLIYTAERREGVPGTEGGAVAPVGLNIGLGVEAAGTVRAPGNAFTLTGEARFAADAACAPACTLRWVGRAGRIGGTGHPAMPGQR